MRKIIVLLISLSFFTLSCGEKYEEMKNVAEAIKNAPEAAENVSKTMDLAEKKREERRAKGDTLALHFSELQKYLPESIPGFKSSEPTGQTTNITGFSMSTAERDYTASDDSGRRLKITLVDYNEAYSVFAGVSYWASMNLSTETSEGYSKSYTTDNATIAAMEELSKSNKTAKIMYAVGYRFIVTIEEDQANSIDDVKLAASKIDMNKLASY